MSMLFWIKLTCPSTNEAFSPCGWSLPAARVLGSVSLGGRVPYTNPWDWWWTQKNWLQPIPFEHQLWLVEWDFSRTRKVLLVPSVTSAMRTALLTQPMPVYGPRLPVWRLSGQQFSPKGLLS